MKFVLPIILLFVCSLQCFGQKGSSTLDSTRLVKKSNNIIKYDPLQLRLGEVPISWEHRMTKRSSFELTLGPTISGLFGNDRFWLEPFDHYGNSIKLGGVIGFSTRFYLNKNKAELRKLYLSPALRYRVYRDNLSDYVDETLLTFSIGYQCNVSRLLLLDYYIGFGVENVRHYGYNVYYSSINYTYSHAPRPYGQFTGTLGVKISIKTDPNTSKRDKPDRTVSNEVNDTNPKKQKKSELESRRLAVKFQPDRILFADYEIGIEVRVSKDWSVELEGGVTKSHKGIERFYSDFPLIPYSDIGDLSTSALGYVGSLGFKYYFKEKASQLAHMYVSPRLKFRRYNDYYYFKNYDYENNIDYSVDRRGFLNETLFSFVVGNQFWLLKYFGLDVYAGIGIGRLNGEYFSIGNKPPGIVGFHKHYITTMEVDRMLPFPVLGLKFSVGF